MNTNSLFQPTNGTTNGIVIGTRLAKLQTITPASTFTGQTFNHVTRQIAQPMLGNGNGSGRGRTANRIQRPLIVIGAGGSGRWIVTNIKAILLQMFGTLPENVALLALDSGAEVINVRDPFGRSIQLENGSELISLGKVPIAGIKRNPEYQNEMADRLGENLRKISRQSIVEGCAQSRIEGLATFYYHFDAIHTTLTRAIQRVTKRNNDVEESNDDAQKLNIVLVGSMTGGQGSGILLDLALVIRQLLAEQGGWEDTAQLTGFFLLPSAFNDLKERDKRNMAPNAVAFLHELEMLQRGEAIEARYPNRVNVRNIDAPFDHVYVVEGIDERGYVWSNQKEICQMTARGIVLLTAGQIGMAEIAFALNQHSVLMRTSRSGYRSYLAALGLSELYYPGDLVLNIALLRHQREMLNSALHSASAEPLPDVASDAPSLTLPQLLAELQNGIATRVQIQLPADLRAGDVGQIAGKARDYVGRFKTRRVYELHFVQLDQQAGKLLDLHHHQIARWLDRLGSLDALPQIQQAIRHSLRQIAALMNEVQQARKSTVAEIEQKKRETTAADVAMVQAVESFFIGRKERTINAVNHYVDEAEQLVLLEVRERELMLVESILQRLEEQQQESLAAVDETILRLQTFANHSQSEEQRLLATPMSQNVINLADSDLIDALYQHYAPSPGNTMQSALLKGEGWWKLSQQSNEALLWFLQDAATPSFQTLATRNVEDVLRQRWPERSADAWVKLLTEKAAVAWNVDRAKLPPGADSLALFLTLGVPDGENSFFAKAGHTCTTTGDPQRIIALRTVYGGTIDSLKSLPRWEAEYKAAVKVNLPMHLFGSFEPNKERVLAIFGLGLLFEFLHRNKSWFVYHPQDVLNKPVQLAQGTEKSIEALTGNASLLAELEQRSNVKIAEIGHVKAAQLMRQWVEHHQDREDELFTPVLRAVRSYADQLK